MATGVTRRLLGVVLFAIPASAVAAPFCVETDAIPPQCIFYDAAQCNKRAAEMGGQCTVDSSQVQVSTGIGHYCLLTSSKVTYCVFAGRDDCDREAKHQQGVCIQAPGSPEAPGADPYRNVRPLMAGG